MITKHERLVPLALCAALLAACSTELHLGDPATEAPADGGAPAPDALASSPASPAMPALGDEIAVDDPVPAPDMAVLEVDAAFDGDIHLVVWQGRLGLAAMRFDRDGVSLDRGPIVIAPRSIVEGSVRVFANDAGGFTVFWVGADTWDGVAVSADYRTLYVAHVARDGATSEPHNVATTIFPSLFGRIGRLLVERGPMAGTFYVVGERPGGVGVALLSGSDSAPERFGALDVSGIVPVPTTLDEWIRSDRSCSEATARRRASRATSCRSRVTSTGSPAHPTETRSCSYTSGGRSTPSRARS